MSKYKYDIFDEDFIIIKTGEKTKIRIDNMDPSIIYVLYNDQWYMKPRSIIGRTIIPASSPLRIPKNKSKKHQHNSRNSIFDSFESKKRDSEKTIEEGCRVTVVEITSGHEEKFELRNPNVEYEYKKEDIVSKSKNTPWIGKKLKGKVAYTIVSGKIVYEA